MAYFVILLLSTVALAGFPHLVLARSMETQLQGPSRHAREVTEDQVELVMEKIRHGLTRLRHAEDRIKTFADKIDSAIENGELKKLISQAKDAAEGNEDLVKVVNQYKTDDHTPTSFEELIKRISDDTHILMDQLHGRLDDLGNLIKEAQHDPSDASAEQHHKSS